MIRNGIDHERLCNTGRIWQLRIAVVAFVLLSMTISGASSALSDDELFKKCKACHQIGEGARNKVGPHLNGVFGRIAGSLEGFKYSKAMREAGSGGLVWDRDNLSAYLEKPRTFIPGNRMSFRGMKDASERDELIAYLEKASTAEPPQQSADANAPTSQVKGFADIVLAMDGDPEYGEYLASECITCHQASGHADGIPSIVGVPKDYFVRSLFEYKSNIRKNEVMKLRVTNLTNEEIAALAAYFVSLQPD